MRLSKYLAILIISVSSVFDPILVNSNSFISETVSKFIQSNIQRVKHIFYTVTFCTFLHLNDQF